MSPEEQEAAWRERRAAIRSDVRRWLKRGYHPPYSGGVQVHDAGRKGSRGGKGESGSLSGGLAGGAGGGGIQLSLDETVQWVPGIGNAWELVVPWQLKQKLELISREEMLPTARPSRHGERTEEQRIAERLQWVADELQVRSGWAGWPVDSHKYLRVLAGEYRKLDTCYYTLPGLESTPASAAKSDRAWSYKERWMQLRANAVLAQEHALTWAAELALKGVPKRVSTFIVEPLYSLRDADGKYTRAILVLSDTGKVFGPLQMEGVDYSGPKALREFLNTRAGGSWMAGERELQVAMTDWAPVFDWKEVEKVGRIGWHAEAEAWFFGDGAIDFEGQPVLPDRYDRIRLRVPKGAGAAHGLLPSALRNDGPVNGPAHGPADGQLPSALPKDGSSAYPAREYQWRYFQLSDRDRDGMPFEFGQLNMHLTEKVDGEEVRELFCEMCRRMYLSVGGLDAFMGLGIVLAFSAAPEVFHHLKFFPGVWIHGKAQQGKSVYGGWLAMLYGINTIKNLNVSTGAGAEMCFGQYSNIPLLLDEAQTGMNPAVADMLMSAFNRGTSAKRVERKRDISTNAIVQGVATGHNGQLKSRFPHVLMSKENRLPMPGQVRLDAEGHPMVRDGQQVYWDELSAAEEQGRNYERMKELQDSFWKITRWALEHRREFASAAVAAVKEFGARRDLAGLEERNKLVHGVAMAGMRAMVSILSPKGDLRLTPTAALWPETLGQFAQHLVRRAAWAQKGVKDVGEMEEFWQELLDGVKTGLFGTEWDEMRLYFHVRESEHGTGFAPNLPDQSYQLLTDGSAPVFPWTSYELAIADTVVYAKLEESVRRKGRSMKLRLPDIKSMLSGEPYWIPVQRGERVKFEKGSQGSHQFWRINLDAFEDLGYRAMADNDLVQWLKKAVDEFKREESTEGGALPHVVHEFGLSKEQLRVCFSQVSQDPRRGELFRIVEKWREHKMKNRQ